MGHVDNSSRRTTSGTIDDMSLDHYFRVPTRLPIARSQTGALRIGHDHPEILPVPSPQALKFIEQARLGLSAPSLIDHALQAGVARREATGLVRALTRSASALTHTRPTSRRRRIAVFAESENAQVVARMLQAAGHAIKFGEAKDVSGADLIVFVERYLGNPRFPAFWLAEGTPHLLIRLSDETIQVGPVFSEGGPCHGCLNQAEISRDSDWAYAVAQLMGRPTPMEESPFWPLAAAHAVVFIERFHAGDARVLSEQVLISGDPTVPPTSRTVHRHPSCGCTLLEEENQHSPDRTAA